MKIEISKDDALVVLKWIGDHQDLFCKGLTHEYLALTRLFALLAGAVEETAHIGVGD